MSRLSSTSSNRAFRQISPDYTSLLYYFNHLGDDYPEQSTQQRPLCPPTPLQHIDPLPTDMKSYTNITWDYKSGLVRAWGALAWLSALAWEGGKCPGVNSAALWDGILVAASNDLTALRDSAGRFTANPMIFGRSFSRRHTSLSQR